MRHFIATRPIATRSVGMGKPALGGSSGNAVQPSLACAAAHTARSRRRSRFGRGRSKCRSKLGRDSPRKETASPAARHHVRIRYRHVDERRDCQDNVLACVPSTVWGTASRRNCHVGLGAVLALKSAYANKLHAPRQPKPGPQNATQTADGPHSSTRMLVQSALGSSLMSGRIHDDVTPSASNKRGIRPPPT